MLLTFQDLSLCCLREEKHILKTHFEIVVRVVAEKVFSSEDIWLHYCYVYDSIKQFKIVQRCQNIQNMKFLSICLWVFMLSNCQHACGFKTGLLNIYFLCFSTNTKKHMRNRRATTLEPRALKMTPRLCVPYMQGRFKVKESIRRISRSGRPSSVAQWTC